MSRPEAEPSLTPPESEPQVHNRLTELIKSSPETVSYQVKKLGRGILNHMNQPAEPRTAPEEYSHYVHPSLVGRQIDRPDPLGDRVRKPLVNAVDKIVARLDSYGNGTKNQAEHAEAEEDSNRVVVEVGWKDVPAEIVSFFGTHGGKKHYRVRLPDGTERNITEDHIRNPQNIERSAEDTPDDAETADAGTSEDEPVTATTGSDADTSSGIPDELLAEAAEQGLNPDAVKKAYEKGIRDPVDFLSRVLKSSDNSASRRWEAILGAPLKSPPAPDPDKPPDRLTPEEVRKRTQRGQKRGEVATKLRDDVIKHPYRVRHSLKRVGGPIPGVRRVRQRHKAKQIFKVKKEEEKEKGIVSDNGWLGRGRKRRRGYLRSIKRTDAEIVVDRAKLVPHRKNELKDAPSERAYLGDRILKHHENLHALKKKRLNPDELENHELEPVWDHLGNAWRH